MLALVTGMKAPCAHDRLAKFSASAKVVTNSKGVVSKASGPAAQQFPDQLDPHCRTAPHDKFVIWQSFFCRDRIVTFRADAARRGSAQSSGLGLSIVRTIMNLHGGHASAQSTGGRKRFVLAFPHPAPGRGA
jgi:hypothetical protein